MSRTVLRILFVLLVLFNASVFSQELNLDQRTEAWQMRAKVYEPLIVSTARRYDLDPHLLWTIAYLESRFRSDAVSYKNGKPCAYGLMQFTVPTALRYGLTNPHDPKESIDAAARYVRDLQARFGPRPDLVLAAYNAGEGTVEAFRDGKTLVLPNSKIINPRGLRTGGIPPYKETREYVAQGRIIYRKLTREPIFQEATSVSKSSPNQPSNTPLGDVGRPDSFYVSGATRKSHEPTLKPVRSNKSSIYAN